MNKPGNIIQNINPLSRFSGKEYIGLDFSSNNLKVAYLRTVAGKLELVNVAYRNIAGLSEEDISKIIRGSVAELNAKKASVITAIPAHMVISKNIEIPSTNPAEIREIISLQAGRHTPYSREEIIVDYIDIGTYKHSYTKVLLIIVARQVVRRQFDIIEKAGLQLEKVLFAPEGIAWFMGHVLKVDSENAPIALVHIDENFTDFSVIFRAKAIFIRSISIGAQHLSNELEKYKTRFVEEIKNSLEAYQSEDIEKPPVSVYFTGASEESRDIITMLKELVRLPVQTVAYAKNFLIASEAFNKVVLAKHLSFLNATSVLLAGKELKINLIPEEIKLRKLIEERGRELIKTGIFVLTMFVLIFSLLISKIYFKTAYLGRLEAKFQPISKDAQALEYQFVRLGFLKNYLSKRGLPLEVLTELYDVIGDTIQLSDIRFDDQSGKLTIRGTSESMSDVFDFVERISKSKYLKDVKTKYTTKRKEGEKDLTDFEIGSSLKKRSDR